jgi:hypothetical protein
MSLFPDEDIFTKEIETWRGFIDKLPSDDDKAVFTKLLDDCYKYAVAINSHDHPFPAEPLIMSMLLSQHKLIRQLESVLRSVHLMVKHTITAAMKQLEIRSISMDSLMVACLLRVTQEMYVNQLRTDRN